MRFLILFLFLCAFSVATLSAQEVGTERTDSVAKIDGKEYLIHTVVKKQTLFSIAKAYEVKLSSIAFDNPGVLSGIQPGQHLKILKTLLGESIEETTDEKPLAVDGEFVLYQVPARQTLYAISKEYNTTVSAILDANPQITDGLKVGSTIRIPVPKLLSLQKSGKVKMVGLPAILSQMVLQKEQTVHSETQVVLMLPFYLGENDTLEAHRLMEEPEEIYQRSEMALQFYEGFLLAADSLAKLGHKVNLKVIDTENRPWKVQQLIKKGELNKADLIIGPFYSKVFAEVEKFGYEHCIPVVSPTMKRNSIINHNPYVFKLIPSEESMLFEIGKYVANSDSTNNMILHFGSEKELKWVRKFTQGLMSDSLKKGRFPVYNVSRIGKDSVRQALSLIDRNNVVILSDDEVKLSSLIRKLSDWSEDAYIVVYAPSSWAKLRSLDVDHFDRLRLHIPQTFFVDYEDFDTQRFVLKFRSRYKAEPSTFAFRGYDLAMHFLQNIDALKEYGAEYMLRVSDKGLQSGLGWRKLEGGGYENFRTHIVDYTNLDLKKAVD